MREYIELHQLYRSESAKHNDTYCQQCAAVCKVYKAACKASRDELENFIGGDKAMQ